MTAGTPQGTAGSGRDAVLANFPGAVAITHLTRDELDAEIARLDESSARRGVYREHLPRRPLSESELLDAHCNWLHTEHRMNVMGVVTFTDKVAERCGIYTFDRALDFVWHGLTADLNSPAPFVMAAEHHRTGRQVPHVHLALSIPPHRIDAACMRLRNYFDSAAGRSRFELMRDTTAATLYGLKDVVKSTKVDTSGVRYRLQPPKRVKW